MIMAFLMVLLALVGAVVLAGFAKLLLAGLVVLGGYCLVCAIKSLMEETPR